MLGSTRTAAVARLAAALVAVILSGAPRVLAAYAPVEGHRCACKSQAGGHHECDCAICRKSALSAQASDESLPPCHRKAARQALARSAPTGSPNGAPCVEGTCGNWGQPPVTIAGVEPFCLPAIRAVTVALVVEERPPSTPRLQERSPAPETPPPKPA